MESAKGLHIKIGCCAELITTAQRIRHQVFVVEQAIPLPLERDGLDSSSFHIVVSHPEGQAIATARLWVNGHQGVLARVAVVKAYRGKGVGSHVIKALLSYGSELGLALITIQAHAYLRDYYEQFGFVFISEVAKVGEHPLIAMHYQYQLPYSKTI